jgi:hypothetical protein
MDTLQLNNWLRHFKSYYRCHNIHMKTWFLLPRWEHEERIYFGGRTYVNVERDLMPHGPLCGTSLKFPSRTSFIMSTTRRRNNINDNIYDRSWTKMKYSFAQELNHYMIWLKVMHGEIKLVNSLVGWLSLFKRSLRCLTSAFWMPLVVKWS